MATATKATATAQAAVGGGREGAAVLGRRVERRVDRAAGVKSGRGRRRMS